MAIAPKIFRRQQKRQRINGSPGQDFKPPLRTNTQIEKHAVNVRRQWWGLRPFLSSSPILLLLFFVPIGILGGHNGWNPTFVFSMNMLAILPLAMLLSNATEELAAEAGEVVGALLNATFGNAVEMIVRSLAFTKSITNSSRSVR
jgi:hypothetical protein